MQRILNSHPALWALLAVPAAVIFYRYATGAMVYGEVVHASGEWAAGLLVATLAVTPVRLAFQGARWPLWLIRRRRALGVATFGYALIHTLVYLARKADWARIVEEGLEPGLLTGWIALVVFAALALTSNDASVRRLGRGWKRLHRLVYLGAALSFAHWLLVAFDITRGLIFLAVLVGLEAFRLVRSARPS